MPIAPLPQSTARAIGSISVISNSCSVVKELVDNALDAGATSVSVDIALNTLDIIQVTDNGSGIRHNDRTLVCRRNCTSKIQTIDDLNNVGGSSLGFRGEALASAAEMCGAITVTTRVDGEITGEILKYGRDGELSSTSKISHPAGTTVRVSDFLKYIPVRRQTALKSASKTLTRMKKLLYSYALSRPEVRLSFKVLKSRSGGSWIYAPKSGATISDAVLAIGGKDVLSQCITRSWPNEGAESGESCRTSAMNTQPVRLVATLPRPDADFCKVNNGGPYVSVDRRPMTTSRGTSKELVKLFKSHVQTSSLLDAQKTAPSDPFFCLHVYCSPGSYDANVEPSKDDFIFADPQSILSLAKDLFTDVYGRVLRGNTPTGGDRISIQPHMPLRAQGAPLSDVPRAMPSTTSFQTDKFMKDRLLGLNRHTERSNYRPTSSGASREDRASEHPTRHNPWTLAKTNATTHHTRNVARSDSESPLLTPAREAVSSPFRPPSFRKIITTHLAGNGLLSPAYSDPPLRRGRVDESPTRLRSNQTPPSKRLLEAEKRTEDRNNASLTTWLPRPCRVDADADAVSLDAEDDEDNIEVPGELSQIAISGRFGSQPRGHTTNPISVNSPTSPVSGLPTPVSETSSGMQNVRPRAFLASTPGLLPLTGLPEKSSETTGIACERSTQQAINEALDFEHRKKAAIQLQRQRLNNQGSLDSIRSRGNELFSKDRLSSPHYNRYMAAKAALSSTPRQKALDTPRATAEVSIDDSSQMLLDDAQTYYTRHTNPQQDASPRVTSGLRTQRKLTSGLPLERIPEGAKLHDLAITLPYDPKALSALMKVLTTVDSYVVSDSGNGSLFDRSYSQAELASWSTCLLGLVRERFRSENADVDMAINLNLDEAFRQHTRLHENRAC
ncbi:hypothetical protein AJ80_01513 [Polytolypa hystricis UAMH7299]|uniref:DNA mismatch repair protein S5 domain-containing protein n=1 Tax=Polytolypa hystricis (strain UAMH7299) TaxID=1447883 RepID=A0A2B7Z0I5_POLH7|nr:hypothetical protein AJ80_01513 [Polytolypa hystricis UAMH7299]